MIIFLLLLASVEGRAIPLPLKPISIPSFVTDQNGNVWVADYRGEEVWKYSPSGELLLTIDGSGPGPEAIKNPRNLACFGEEIVVFMKYGLVKVYDAQSGEYKRTIMHFLPGSAFCKLDDQSWIALFAGIPANVQHPMAKKELAGAEENVFIFDLDGHVLQKHFFQKKPWVADEAYVNYNSIIFHPSLGFLHAEGADPWINIWPAEGGDFQVQRLKPPKFFKAKPKILEPSKRWDPIAVADWLESFTQIKKLGIVDNQLWVLWKTHKPHPFTLSIYSFETFEKAYPDIPLKGEWIGTHNQTAYFIEKQESVDGFDESFSLKTYRIEDLYSNAIH